MNRLIINEKSTEFFFSSESSKEDIFLWISEELLDYHKNIFELNEAYSCNVYWADDLSDDVFWICGDEDMKTIEVEEIKPISL